MSRVHCALEREFRFHLPLSERVYLLLSDRPNVVLDFPCAVVVIESVPLAEVLHLPRIVLALRDDAFDCLVQFEFLLIAFSSEQNGFPLFR